MFKFDIYNQMCICSRVIGISLVNNQLWLVTTCIVQFYVQIVQNRAALPLFFKYVVR